MTYEDFVRSDSVQKFVQNSTSYGSQYKMFQFLKLRTSDELNLFLTNIKGCHQEGLYGLIPMIENILEAGTYAKN